MKKCFTLFILISFLPIYALAQSAYFADGYHGGVYGHYPKWQTQFMMDKLHEFPGWRINLEIEPETFDSVKVWDANLYRNFQQFVDKQDGKTLEFTNPTYSQPYCYNISGESLIRQFSYGMKRMRNHFPSLAFSTYAVEEPCFTSALPQILTLFGFRYAVLKNPDTCWGGYMSAYGGELVRWIGPDGTGIITVPRYAVEHLEDNSTWQTTAWNNSEKYLKACRDAGIKHPAGMCYQDAGWKNGPWIGDPDKIQSTYMLWSHYLDTIADKQAAEDWKLGQEDVLVSLMWGSQVLQKLAQEIRVTENKLVQTEKIASVRQFFQNKSWNQETLDEAWRGLLLSQHHDCWIVPYNKMGSSGKTWAENVSLYTTKSNELCDRLIGSHLSPSENILIYNTTGIDREELVSYTLPQSISTTGVRLMDVKGKAVPFQTGSGGKIFFYARVPSMGYTSYALKPGKNKTRKGISVKQMPDGNLSLESDLYILEINAQKGGTISSLYSKADKREWVDDTSIYAFNELRGNFYEEGGFLSSAMQPAELIIEEQGPFLVKIRVDGKIGMHPFSQSITLVQGEPRIDVKLEINWQGNPLIGEYKDQPKWENVRRPYYDDRYKLHLLFPTTLKDQQIDKDAPFDVCRSQLQNTFFSNWDQIKNNVILNWVDVYGKNDGYGVALFSDHTTSYLHGEDYPLGLTVQYSGAGLWGQNYGINGKTGMEYSLLPHQGTWRDAKITYEKNRHNEPFIVLNSLEGMGEASFLALPQMDMEVSAMYYEGTDLLVRLYNEGEAGEKLMELSFIPESIDEINLNGENIQKQEFMTSVNKTIIKFNMPAFGIKTLRISMNNDLIKNN